MTALGMAENWSERKDTEMQICVSGTAPRSGLVMELTLNNLVMDMTLKGLGSRSSVIGWVDMAALDMALKCLVMGKTLKDLVMDMTLKGPGYDGNCYNNHSAGGDDIYCNGGNYTFYKHDIDYKPYEPHCWTWSIEVDWYNLWSGSYNNGRDYSTCKDYELCSKSDTGSICRGYGYISIYYSNDDEDWYNCYSGYDNYSYYSGISHFGLGLIPRIAVKQFGTDNFSIGVNNEQYMSNNIFTAEDDNILYNYMSNFQGGSNYWNVTYSDTYSCTDVNDKHYNTHSADGAKRYNIWTYRCSNDYYGHCKAAFNNNVNLVTQKSIDFTWGNGWSNAGIHYKLVLTNYGGNNKYYKDSNLSKECRKNYYHSAIKHEEWHDWYDNNNNCNNWSSGDKHRTSGYVKRTNWECKDSTLTKNFNEDYMAKTRYYNLNISWFKNNVKCGFSSAWNGDTAVEHHNSGPLGNYTSNELANNGCNINTDWGCKHYGQEEALQKPYKSLTRNSLVRHFKALLRHP